MATGERRIAVAIVIALLVATAAGIGLFLGLKTGGPKTSADGTAAPSNDGRGPPESPFGVYISVRTLDFETRIRVARELGALYFRTYPVLVPTWDGQCEECASAHAAGLRYVIDIHNSSSFTTPANAVTDMDDYKRRVGEIIDVFKPALVVAENEENAPGYWAGTPQQYADELTALCEVAHSKGVKCANGGLFSESVTWLLYFHYLDSGDADRAASWADQAFVDFQKQQLTTGAVSRIRTFAEITATFLGLYRSTGADYMNFHWYVPNGDAMKTMADYLGNTTGMPTITNEVGQRDMDPTVTETLMNAVRDMHMPIAVWFSADSRLAKALEDPDGSLRETGEAFLRFIVRYYG